jgi:hypothetical protein
MSTLERLWRNTGLIAAVMAIWFFVYGAALFFLEQAALPTALMLVLALIVGIGLLPGSYLPSFLDRGAVNAAKVKPPLIVALALTSPVVFLVPSALGAYSEWGSLRWAAEHNFDTTSSIMILSLLTIVAATGAVFLLINVVTLIRIARAHKQEPN